MLILFLSKEQLQHLVDKVAEAVGEKHKYVARINLRRRGAVAFTRRWIRGDTNRRMMDFGRDDIKQWFGSDEDKRSLLETIVEEIVHFKVEGRRYKNKNKWVPRHRYHTKSFHRLMNKMLERLQPHVSELLKLDLSAIQPLPKIKPKPTKADTIKTKLAKVENHIRLLETRIKRSTTLLKKWKKKQKYYQKQMKT